MFSRQNNALRIKYFSQICGTIQAKRRVRKQKLMENGQNVRCLKKIKMHSGDECIFYFASKL